MVPPRRNARGMFGSRAVAHPWVKDAHSPSLTNTAPAQSASRA